MGYSTYYEMSPSLASRISSRSPNQLTHSLLYDAVRFQRVPVCVCTRVCVRGRERERRWNQIGYIVLHMFYYAGQEVLRREYGHSLKELSLSRTVTNLGHRGVVGNEIADTNAKEAARGRLQTRRAKRQCNGSAYPSSNEEQRNRPQINGEITSLSLTKGNEPSTCSVPIRKRGS